MASEQGPVPHAPEIIAVAFVVESSLTVANDWVRIIMDYVSPMLRRLTEMNPGCKPRMGFVTYAMADTLPSPILCKRFFTDFQLVTKEMKDAPMNLGIGTTNSGGSRGMAALEGLVAAIEVFDTLHDINPKARPPPSHIFHIASASPDASLHPQWNDSPALDSVTWEGMPAELKKRNISFSTINLWPNLARFPELHAAVAPGAPKEPWFPTRPQHTVLLGGFPMSPQKIVKRPGDVHTTPDPKRARLANAPAEASPSIAAATTPSNPPKPSPLLPPQARVQPPAAVLAQVTAQAPAQLPAAAVPAAPVTTNVAPGPGLPNLNVHNLTMAAKSVEDQIRGLAFSIQAAKNQGNAALAETLQQELAKKQALHLKFKNTLIAFSKKQGQPQPGAPTQNPAQNAGPGQGAPIAGPSVQKTVPEARHPPNQLEPQLKPQALAAQLGHGRTPSGTGPMPGAPQVRPPMTQVPNAVMAAQIQKMEQQRARAMQPTPNMAVNMGMKPAGPVQPQAGPSSDPHSAAKGPSPVWQGTLSFSGTDQLGNKKETIVWVVANTPSTVDSRAETWPAAMALMPAREPAVPLQDLQTWIKRTHPVLCTFAPQMHNIPDPAANEANFKNLATLLMTRNAYAVAAWTLPSGEQGNNILFFPINGASLAGACFPVTGIPEMPKTSHPTVLDPNNPEFRARLAAMTPEQRDAFINQVKQQRALQLQRQAMMAQGMGAPGNNPGANNAAALAAMNAMGMGQQQNQQPPPPQQPMQHADMSFGGNVHPLGNYGGMGMMNTMGMGQQQAMMTAGMPRPVNTGMRNPIPPNINYEMLQSFMQRNPDGGGSGMAQ
ncbi:hypothetical protein LshimejAT787_0401690 [Lyophyllum shimeji]|uniref:Mediator of RNA polymerase II transcription subunit 25 von Willebrand factor type A domain-containing protein n=1 Tax=Lyophyllum shimeji TaxID=47721 RepID=A0A9P3UKY6_LYOSH|nr:hypothetical protein LshimejAT787_0401690 [Lyophyllum shimeji]